jgi:formylglycine-generating enzyme required for sulfatase activity
MVRILAGAWAVTALTVAAGCDRPATEPVASIACAAQPSGEARLEGGAFTLGAAPRYPEEGPPTRVTVAPFSMDRTEVTNAQFAAFVEATGHVTEAERRPDPKLYPGVPPKSLTAGLDRLRGGEDETAARDPGAWWRVVPGANWRHPKGTRKRDRRAGAPSRGPRQPSGRARLRAVEGP